MLFEPTRTLAFQSELDAKRGGRFSLDESEVGDPRGKGMTVSSRA